ncbi:inhibitor of growth protein 3 [Cladorrhinum sp. PSN332]|nr:inhibitor of growth protein 3 [Cladorrhinum sp. PSN332]
MAATVATASTEPGRPDAEAADIDDAISPRNPVPSASIEQAVQSIINPLDLRADPDAQATVSDFLDFTEYLPADIMRSLTLIGQLDQNYIDASSKVHELTTVWGQLPSLPQGERPYGPVELRSQISETMQHAMNSRIYSHAEAQRMTENVNRHYNRAKTILAKLQTMLENYPPPEEQKSPVAAKSPQMSRAPKITLRVDGEKARRPRVPRITVPGEVLAPYELNYDAYTTGSDSSSEEEDEDEGSSSRVTPAPHARIKVVKPSGSRPPKPGGRSTVRARTSVPPSGALGHLSTSQQLAQLAPPPENAVPGSADAPWCQLTPFELARLRKRMKKNAAWTPSDTMVARELSALGRGVEAFKKAKAKAEEEGMVFEGQMPVPSIDPETGEKRLPPGALTSEALASDDKAISNRGMKLNEAKKLKREMLAKMAAEEAEQSAKSFEMMARAIMSDAAPPMVQDQAAKAASRNKAAKKRKRDSVPEGDAEKPEVAIGQAQRPQFKRTKTETPVPPPLLTSGSSLVLPPQETPVQHPQRAATGSTVLHSTTPIPLPVHALDQSITAKAASVASATSPAGSIAGPSNTSTIAPLKLPTSETPIPLPIISPTKKSATPILPPVRESRKAPPRAANQDSQQQQQQKDSQTLQLPKPLTSRTASPELTSPKPDPDAPSAVLPPITSTPATATTTTPTAATTVTRRPASRGKAMSQEPSGPPPAPAIPPHHSSLAADRPRRTSTARNTPAPPEVPSSSSNNPASSTLANPSSSFSAAGGSKPAHHSKRAGKRPAPGVISRTNSGGNSAVGTRKAAPRKKAASTRHHQNSNNKKEETTTTEVEVDDEGNVIDDDEPRYCLCNRVSFGTMIQCDNVDHCKQEWFHLECVGLSDIPARTTKWYCPDCRVLLKIGEKGEVSARGVRA